MTKPARSIRRIRPIGLIGLGLMGNAIAERLLRAGHSVLGWDIAPKARTKLIKLGGEAATNAEEIFKRCNRILLSLPESRVTRTVLRAGISQFHHGHIIADTTTGDPHDAVELSRQLAPTGATYLDTTISGNSDQLRRGEVLLMVGGPKPAFIGCQELFAAFATRTIHTGTTGSGARMKLVTNLVLGLNRAALAEGLVFARALKLDGRQTLKILRSSMAYSRIMDVKGEKMLRGDFKPQARLSQHLKDVRLMLAAAAKARAQLPLTTIHCRILEAAEIAGLGQLDNSALIRVIANPRIMRPIRRSRPIPSAQ